MLKSEIRTLFKAQAANNFKIRISNDQNIW
jgi:hypothetical protein